MTIRHKLADWISGGELTRLRSESSQQGMRLAKSRTALREIACMSWLDGSDLARLMSDIARGALE